MTRFATAAAAIVCMAAAAAPRHATAQVFAPYIDMSLTDSEFLATKIQPQSGASSFTLAFVVAGVDGTGKPTCDANWSGIGPIAQDTLANGTTIQQVVAAVRQNGGNVIISFGGQIGEEVALGCATVTALQAVYQQVVTRYNATSLDFDLETSDELSNQSAITLRDKALIALKAANPGLQISFTLPVSTTGLLPNAYNILTSAHGDGLNPDIVNIMAMTYGIAQTTGQMLTDAETAAKATEKQIGTAHLTSLLGITTMIGVNNPAGSPVETFTLADATKLEQFAAATHAIGRLAMWSLGRDFQCPSGTVGAQPTCSGVTQSPYAFAKTFDKY
jgi:hypothetical protein